MRPSGQNRTRRRFPPGGFAHPIPRGSRPASFHPYIRPVPRKATKSLPASVKEEARPVRRCQTVRRECQRL
jgi:hypothetical protein